MSRLCFTSSDRRRRSGFTLLELILVLALLVVITALAVPAIRAPLDSQRLRRAGNLTRIEWSKARLKAMKTGLIHVFYYQNDTNRYRIQPWATDDGLVTGGATELGLEDLVSASADPGTLARREAELPEGIIFVESQSDDDARALALQAGVPEPTALEGQWSRPIFFYPDGTTSTVRLMLANQRGRTVVVDLRGLTGIARVIDSASLEEPEQ